MSNLRSSKYSPLWLSLITLTFALTACNPQANTEVSPSLAALDSSESALPPLPDVQPMVAGPAAPVRRAPTAAALPKAKTLGYASATGNDRYAWIDRANRINETIGDAPPDYGFDYQDGVEPYGWESAGGYRTYAEPVDGGYRTYYYDPGAREPYLVRDPTYSYGYSGGRIVTVYDRGGRVLDGDQAQRQADYASRYYDRGRAMRAAADSRQRRGVAAAGWADRREVISRQRSEWNHAQSNTPEWRAYRNDHAVQDQQLAQERAVRAQAARQFVTWQAQGFRGQPPALYGQPQTGRGRDSGFMQRQQEQQAQQDMARTRQQQQVQQQRAQQQQAALAAKARAQDLVLRQQRNVVARQQSAVKQAQAVQQRNAQVQAHAAKQAKLRADKIREQQQRSAAQTEKLRVDRQSQLAVRQKRAAARTEQVRVARERQVAAKAQAVRQRAATAASKAAVKPAVKASGPAPEPTAKVPEHQRPASAAKPQVKPDPREPGLPHPSRG